MVDFTSILVKRILKTLFKIYDGFCVMMDFPYELFVIVKCSSGLRLGQCNVICWHDSQQRRSCVNLELISTLRRNANVRKTSMFSNDVETS